MKMVNMEYICAKKWDLTFTELQTRYKILGIISKIVVIKNVYNKTKQKVASSYTSRLEAHAGIYRFLMKGIFNAYVIWPFDKKLFFEIILRIDTLSDVHYFYIV